MKTILKTNLTNLRFPELCKRLIMSINLNYIVLKSKKGTAVCEALFYVKYLNLLALEYFLAYLRSSVKTTIIYSYY